MSYLDILWYAFLVMGILGVIGSLIFSFLIWAIYKRDRPDALQARRDFLAKAQLIEDILTEPGDPDAPDPMDEFRVAVGDLGEAIVTLSGQIDGVPRKTRDVLNGSKGRSKQLADKEAEEVMALVNKEAIDQALSGMPAVYKGIALKAIEKYPEHAETILAEAMKRYPPTAGQAAKPEGNPAGPPQGDDNGMGMFIA